MSARYSSQTKDAGPLANPLTFEFSGKTAPNRFLKAAMTERMSSWDPTNKEVRGVPSKELIRVYQRWGEGQLGLILTGNIMVDFDSLEAGEIRPDFWSKKTPLANKLFLKPGI
jgi:2,4-dienoyl-CoA reductase-like NADH-dependent reductase (Old Yellow Enzyme family)